ncbi:hypothetical protein ACFXPS_28975 [Nocardia sp. NPDC059091]|uniref:hypothetical protein n=1 Tax=unclassified Nocardia TaxID=2637762 RepID=UPI0036CDF0D6
MSIETIPKLGAFIANAPAALGHTAYAQRPLLAAVTVAVFLARLVAGWYRRRCRSREAAQAVWLQITPPAALPRDAGVDFARSLAGLLGRTRRRPWAARSVALEFVATDAGTRIGVFVPPGLSVRAITDMIVGAWPGATVEPTTPPELAGRGGVCAHEIMPRAGAWSPLLDPGRRTHGPLATIDTPDPLGHMLTVLAERSPGQTALVQVIVSAQRDTGTTRPVSARLTLAFCGLAWSLLKDLTGILLPGHSSASPGQQTGADLDPVTAAWQREVVAKKAARPHLRVSVRVAICGSVPARYLRGQVERITNGFDPVLTAGDGLLTRRARHARAATTTRTPGAVFVATAPELAALWHLPAHGGVYGVPVNPARARTAQPIVARRPHPTSKPTTIPTAAASTASTPPEAVCAPTESTAKQPLRLPLPDICQRTHGNPAHPNPIRPHTGGTR